MEQAINTLESTVIMTHVITANRLIEIDPDAFLLYMFYVLTAKNQSISLHQLVNPIKATREYCQEGLKWGHKRFLRAKNILMEHEFISDKIEKNTKGLILGHYILIHYLKDQPQNPVCSKGDDGSHKVHSAQKPPMDTEHTNAIDTSNYIYNIYPNSSNSEGAKRNSDYKSTYSKRDPLPPLKLWQIAMDKNVSLHSVIETHKRILEDMAGENKYKVKDVNLTLHKWINLAIGRGSIRTNNEIERMDLESDNPEEVAKRRALIKKAEELDIL